MANKTVEELTAGTAMDGTELFMGVQGDNSRKFTALQLLPGLKGTIASASTITIPYGTFFHVTGTTAITDIDFTGNRDGLGAWLEFDGILTLTHNGTTLNLPGAANILTAAGDRAYVVQDASDNVHVMVYQRAVAPPVIITPWAAYTPTFTGFGTPTSVSFFSRRVGDALEVMGKVATGTMSATEARISLPSGLSVDSSKVPSLRHCGTIIRGLASTQTEYYPMVNGGNAYMTIGNYASDQDGLASRNGDALFGNGDTLSLNAVIPISGW